MRSDPFANGLILAIYRAAEDPSVWPTALESIRAALDATGVVLLHQDRSARHRDILWTHGFDPEAGAYYSSYFNRLDPWGLALRPEHFVDAPRVFDGRELVPAERVKRECHLRRARTPWRAVSDHHHQPRRQPGAVRRGCARYSR